MDNTRIYIGVRLLFYLILSKRKRIVNFGRGASAGMYHSNEMRFQNKRSERYGINYQPYGEQFLDWKHLWQ